MSHDPIHDFLGLSLQRLMGDKHAFSNDRRRKARQKAQRAEEKAEKEARIRRGEPILHLRTRSAERRSALEYAQAMNAAGGMRPEVTHPGVIHPGTATSTSTRSQADTVPGIPQFDLSGSQAGSSRQSYSTSNSSRSMSRSLSSSGMSDGQSTIRGSRAPTPQFDVRRSRAGSSRQSYSTSNSSMSGGMSSSGMSDGQSTIIGSRAVVPYFDARGSRAESSRQSYSASNSSISGGMSSSGMSDGRTTIRGSRAAIPQFDVRSRAGSPRQSYSTPNNGRPVPRGLYNEGFTTGGPRAQGPPAGYHMPNGTNPYGPSMAQRIRSQRGQPNAPVPDPRPMGYAQPTGYAQPMGFNDPARQFNARLPGFNTRDATLQPRGTYNAGHQFAGRVPTYQAPLGDMTRSYLEGMEPNYRAEPFQRRYQ